MVFRKDIVARRRVKPNSPAVPVDTGRPGWVAGVDDRDVLASGNPKPPPDAGVDVVDASHAVLLTFRRMLAERA
jgi:hypothetical protein